MSADFISSFKINFKTIQMETVIPTIMAKGSTISETDTKRILLKYNIMTGKTAKRTG